MNNTVEEPKTPTIFQKVASKIKQTAKSLTDIYYIQICLVENKKVEKVQTQNTTDNTQLTVAEVLEKQYLVLKSDTEIDYTKDVKKASQFKILLATLIVKQLRNLMKDSPNVQIDLVPVANANFVDYIQKGE